MSSPDTLRSLRIRIVLLLIGVGGLVVFVGWIVWRAIPPSLPSPREVEQYLVAEISRDPEHRGATARCSDQDGQVRCLLRDAAGNYGYGGAVVAGPVRVTRRTERPAHVAYDWAFPVPPDRRVVLEFASSGTGYLALAAAYPEVARAMAAVGVHDAHPRCPPVDEIEVGATVACTMSVPVPSLTFTRTGPQDYRMELVVPPPRS